MYVGIDVSKEKMVCVGKDKEGNVLCEYEFSTSKEGMDDLVKKVGRRSTYTVEASTHGLFVYDYMTSVGTRILMANPARIRQIAESEKKTDWEDASILSDCLRTNRLPTCYVPQKEVREVRDTIRQRKSIVDMRTTVKNKMRAICAREGVDIPFSDILGNESLEMLDKLQLENDGQRFALNKLTEIAVLLDKKLGDYEQRIRDRYETMPYAKLLDTIPGVGIYSAVHISSAIGDITRFTSDDKLASYAGLAPKTYQSGETRRDRGLKHGDKLLRWILIQDAFAAVRLSRRFRRYYLKQKRRKGPQKAIISVARKMMEIMYWMLTRGEPYNENYGQ